MPVQDPRHASSTAPKAPSALARRRRRGRVAGRTVLVLTLAVVVGASTFVGGLLAAPFDETQVPPPPKSVLLLAADGTQIGSIRSPKRRDVIAAQDIPDVMRDAIISAEDAGFLEHKGVDPVATVRAAVRDLTGGPLQGGSTLTQQYVKNVYVDDERTIERKIREAAISVRLEQRKTKQEILTGYLNVLYLGNGVYGVQAASRYYYGVDARDLDLDPGTGARDAGLGLARASMLAGVAPAPSAWNPVRDMPTAKVRQRYVLNRMVIDGKISPEQAGDAFNRPIEPVQETPPPAETSAPEFADLVESQLRAQYTGDEEEDLLFRGGLRVTTTLDTDLQEAVSRAAREVLPSPTDPQAAVVALDLRSGDVRALTTLRRLPGKTDSAGNVREPVDGYERFGFNLATNGYRSVGSTLKPFTLAAALASGKQLGERRRAPGCDSIANPAGEPNPYRYCNAGESSYGGSLTLKQALQKSVNTVYVPLANEVGRENVKNVLEAAGAKASPQFPVKTGNLSFGLGAGVEISPLSMTNAFGTLVNSGVQVPPRFVSEVRNESGGVVTPSVAPVGTQVIAPEVADRVAEAMSGVTAGAGTAPRARQPFPVFGKTGTTNDSVDAWFIGCAKEPQQICLGVWMGYEDQTCDGVRGRSCGGMSGVRGVPQVYGGTLPAEIFARTFEILREIQAAKDAPPPDPAAAAETDVEPGDAEAEPQPTATPRRRGSPAPAPSSQSPAVEQPAPASEQPAPDTEPAPPPDDPPDPDPPPEQAPPTRPPPEPELPAPGTDDRQAAPP